jgi:hypothetical protein
MERWSAVTGQVAVTRTFTLYPYESAVLVPGVARPMTASEHLVTAVQGEWSVAFGNHVRPVTLPHRWEDDPAPATYSGSATYRTEIELPEANDRLFLDFGPGEHVPPDSESYLPPNSYRALITPPIGVAADVYLNDIHCGSLWAPPYEVDLTAAARPGRNDLRIVVHNTAANALSADPHLLEAAAEVTERFGRRFDLQHIEHAADFLSSGLLNPPVVVRRSKEDTSERR